MQKSEIWSITEHTNAKRKKQKPKNPKTLAVWYCSGRGSWALTGHLDGIHSNAYWITKERLTSVSSDAAGLCRSVCSRQTTGQLPNVCSPAFTEDIALPPQFTSGYINEFSYTLLDISNFPKPPILQRIHDISPNPTWKNTLTGMAQLRVVLMGNFCWVLYLIRLLYQWHLEHSFSNIMLLASLGLLEWQLNSWGRHQETPFYPTCL